MRSVLEATATTQAPMNRKPETWAYRHLKQPALGPRLLGSIRVGRKPKSANKLLTGDPGTININQYMETVCD
jgi:hypothetical protein